LQVATAPARGTTGAAKPGSVMRFVRAPEHWVSTCVTPAGKIRGAAGARLM
jgi:hypothetical protein